MLERAKYAVQQLEILGELKACLLKCKPVFDSEYLSYVRRIFPDLNVYTNVCKTIDSLIGYWQSPGEPSHVSPIMDSIKLTKDLERLSHETKYNFRGIRTFIKTSDKKIKEIPTDTTELDSCIARLKESHDKIDKFPVNYLVNTFKSSIYIGAFSTAIKRLTALLEARFRLWTGISNAIQMVSETLAILSFSNRMSTWSGVLANTVVHVGLLNAGVPPRFARQAGTIAAITTTTFMEEPARLLNTWSSFLGSTIGVVATDFAFDKASEALITYYNSQSAVDALRAEPVVSVSRRGRLRNE